MIKNDRQLSQIEQRCTELRGSITNLRENHSGFQLRAMLGGFESELAERREEIREYKQLLRLSLEEAIEGPLSRRPMLLGNINEFLAKLRIAAGLTQEEMADRLGWHQPNVSRFESENYGGQTIAKVVEYASALDVWLYTAASPSERPPVITWQTDQPSIEANEHQALTWDARMVAGMDVSDTSESSGTLQPAWTQELDSYESGGQLEPAGCLAQA